MSENTLIQDKVGQAKRWYQSKTIIGVIISFIPTIVKLINPELVVDIEGAIGDGFEGAELIAEAGDQIWAKAVQVFGGLMAIYGRLKARFKLK